MSLLDDLGALESRLDENAIIEYLENLPSVDTPAYWQVWYDMFKEDFKKIPTKHIIIYLKVLMEYYPKYLLWDPEIKYIKETGECKKIWTLHGDLYIYDLNIPDNSISVVGLTEINHTQKVTKKFIDTQIQEVINFFTFEDTIVLGTEVIDVLSTLNKLDSHKTDLSHFSSYNFNNIDDLLDYTIFPYIINAFKARFKEGYFRKEYYILSNGDDIIGNIHKNIHQVSESKYEEIKQYLLNLINIKIKKEDS